MSNAVWHVGKWGLLWPDMWEMSDVIPEEIGVKPLNR